ncbi:RagB/SusD family nutrient uptake outer membrane protein [Chitinophaga sedimenti]|uniref:RagB/SusD family nutrient uptake outer membrane protein n=1 Tax=Chitinophaga sedimenti TaxID=2033606 RepID=UPI002003B5B5|nr:RagB/SusD family nutrient uptake outer membrane protein [Chitinophaga sedimenti]MCK7557787.1 RagB/SusD family nutrient uptake outer membrane protein [Chitinophaga sedimenti]
MKRYYILIITAAVALTSCKKWLDVRPESEVEQEVLFSKEDGFKDAINGLYSRAVIENLYGREMIAGIPEVLSQNYSIGYQNGWNYRETMLFNFKNSTFMDRRDDIWEGLYNVIANANIVLSYVDKR